MIMTNIHDLPTKLTAKKAVILARVSSKEQEEGYSIDAQLHRLEDYCMKRGLEVVKSFALTESSTQGDRRKFMEVIKFIRSQKHVVALVADKVDRVQRSFKEHPLLDGLITQGKIELHFNSEGWIIHKDSMSQERFMWSMGVIMAQSYVDSMRDNIKRSIAQKVRSGEYPSSAPLGYLNVRDANGKAWIKIDPDRGLLVKRLFTEYAKGTCSIPELAKKSRQWGLTSKTKAAKHLSKTQLHRILRNPFYYGVMRVKGELSRHVYEPLIDKELFDKVQAVLDGWGKKPFKYAKKEYVFRGLIKCAATGKVVTADTKTKTYKNGSKASWTYLRCWNPEDPAKKMHIREDIILTQVEKIIDQLHIPQPQLDDITDHIRKTDHVEREYLRRQMTELHKTSLRLREKINQLMDLLMDGVIEREDYKTKRHELIEKLEETETLLKAHQAGDDGFIDALIDLLFIASRSPEMFKGSTIAQKRQLVNFVFANLELKGDKLLYSLNSPFDMFVQTKGIAKWRRLIDRLRTCVKLRATVVDCRRYLKIDK